MAKFNVVYACGCEGVEDIRGKKRFRQQKKEWIEGNKLCPDCYRQANQKENKEINEREGMPELQGVSEKQINYAEKIRRQEIERVNFLKKQFKTNSNLYRLIFDFITKELDLCDGNPSSIRKIGVVVKERDEVEEKLQQYLEEIGKITDAGELLDALLKNKKQFIIKKLVPKERKKQG